jgi:hypothetical protein
MFRTLSLLSSLKPSPLIKTTKHIQHTFKWGIGNKFRSQSANRFTPVHHARPKEVTIEETYFQSPDPQIVYDKLNEQWEVVWQENNKMNGKPFPIKKFGIEESKSEAINFLAELRNSRRLSADHVPKHSSSSSVFWDDRMQSWFAQIQEPRRKYSTPKIVRYSASKHGYEGAKQKAQQTAEKYSRGLRELHDRLDSLVDKSMRT